MAPRRKKPVASVRIALPPKPTAWTGSIPFENLEGHSWGRIVRPFIGGFAPTSAETVRNNSFSPWCSLDLHRFIHRLVTDYEMPDVNGSPKGIQDYYEGVVLPLGVAHGNFFSGSPRPLSEWRDELNRISNLVGIVQQRQAGSWNEDDEIKLAAVLTATYNGMIAFDAAGVVLRPQSLIDYAWLLTARDCWQDISYSICAGCIANSALDIDARREVPDTGLPTARFKSGRPVRHCGRRCSNRASTREKGIKVAMATHEALTDEIVALRRELDELKGSDNVLA